MHNASALFEELNYLLKAKGKNPEWDGFQSIEAKINAEIHEKDVFAHSLKYYTERA